MEKTRRIAVYDDTPSFASDGVSTPGAMRYIEETEIPDVEKAHEVVVGRYYRVPCTLDGHTLDERLARRLNVIVPVVGPLHEDREIIGFPSEHYHIDWRFVTTLFLDDRMMKYRRATRAGVEDYQGFAQPLASVIAPTQFPCRVRATRAAFKNRDGSYRGPVIRRTLRCKRLFAEFPVLNWLPALEQAYRNKQVCHDVCPHRGISLKGVQPNDWGTVVCPGHGLEWDKRTGRMVRRTRAL